MKPAERQSGHPRRDPAPAATPAGAWWRRGATLGVLRALLAPKKHTQSNVFAGSTSMAQSTSLRPRSWTRNLARNWILIVSLVLVCMPIAAVILAYLRRPSGGSEPTSSGSLFGNSLSISGSKPKPAAGKPFPPPSEAPPAVPIQPVQPRPAPVNPPAAVPQNPSTPPITVPAPAPAVPAQPLTPLSSGSAFTPQTFPARHDRHFGEVCSGQLTLNGAGLVFTCPDDPGESVQAPIQQIASVDDNGIRLTSGKKYHFTIPGMSKDAERSLFTNWLTRVR
jgi:hypothetical protein